VGRLAPICVECAQEMHCSKNDFPVKAKTGTVWLGDKFKCETCAHEIVINFGRSRHESEVSSAEVAKALEFKR